jgi:hypothetical protein
MKPFLRFLLWAALLCSPPLLPATIMVPLSITNLTTRADLILRGTVASKTCLKDSEGRIYTKIELKVSEAWKGTLTTNLFQIVHGGGTVGDERTVVDGEAIYEVGEEIVCFLRLNQRGEGVSIGLAQGKFQVWNDDSTGEQFAHNLFHGQPKSDKSAPQTKFGVPPGKPTRLRLAELHSLVTGGGQ